MRGIRLVTAMMPGVFRQQRAMVLLVLSFLAPFLLAADTADLESQKVQHLIASIENLEDAKFIRNGKAYDAKQAADHLRLKLRRAGDRCKTAENFIRYCASASSMSRKRYEIRFATGEQVTTEKFLRDKLAQFKPASTSEEAIK